MTAYHFVLGNESADLDSIVSAIVVSHCASKLFEDRENLFVPVLVTGESTFHLKKYAAFVVFELMHVDKESVFFIETFMRYCRKSTQGQIELSLVDGPKVPLSLQLLTTTTWHVNNVIDHHQRDSDIQYDGHCVYFRTCASNCTNVFEVMWTSFLFDQYPSTSFSQSIFASQERFFWVDNPNWTDEILVHNYADEQSRDLLGLLCGIIVDSLGMDPVRSGKVTIHDIRAALSIIQYLKVGKLISFESGDDEKELIRFNEQHHEALFQTILAFLNDRCTLMVPRAIDPSVQLELDYKDYVFSTKTTGSSFITYGISSVPTSMDEFIATIPSNKKTNKLKRFFGRINCFSPVLKEPADCNSALCTELIKHFQRRAKIIPKFAFFFLMTCCQSTENLSSTLNFKTDNFQGARTLTLCSSKKYFTKIKNEKEAMEAFETVFPGVIKELELTILMFSYRNDFVIISLCQGKYKMSRKAIQPVIEASLAKNKWHGTY